MRRYAGVEFRLIFLSCPRATSRHSMWGFHSMSVLELDVSFFFELCFPPSLFDNFVNMFHRSMSWVTCARQNPAEELCWTWQFYSLDGVTWEWLEPDGTTVARQIRGRQAKNLIISALPPINGNWSGTIWKVGTKISCVMFKKPDGAKSFWTCGGLRKRIFRQASDTWITLSYKFLSLWITQIWILW